MWLFTVSHVLHYVVIYFVDAYVMFSDDPDGDARGGLCGDPCVCE